MLRDGMRRCKVQRFAPIAAERVRQRRRQAEHLQLQRQLSTAIAGLRNAVSAEEWAERSHAVQLLEARCANARRGLRWVLP